MAARIACNKARSPARPEGCDRCASRLRRAFADFMQASQAIAILTRCARGRPDSFDPMPEEAG